MATYEKKVLTSVDGNTIIYPQTKAEITWREDLSKTVEASLQELENRTFEDDLSNYATIAALNDYVTKNTTQSITAKKTFTVSSGDAINVSSGNVTVAGTITGNMVYGAVFNDYAEYRESDELKPGLCVYELGNGRLIKSNARLMPGANIISDTFGFAIGETDKCKTPLAVAGRVLAYPYENKEEYKPGDAVCSGPNGTISKMTREEIREYPERIIGTVSEIPEYKTWGTNNIQIDGRIWIKVK